VNHFNDDKINIEQFKKNNKFFVSSKYQPVVINMKDLLAENNSDELNKFNNASNGTGSNNSNPHLPNITNTSTSNIKIGEKRPSILSFDESASPNKKKF